MFGDLPKWAAAALLLVGVAACTPTSTSEVAERRATNLPDALPDPYSFPIIAAAPPTRSNADMAADFFDLTFELETGRRIPRFTRFEGPISITVAPGAPASLSRDLDLLLDRLRVEARVPISRVPYTTGGANITIETLSQQRMQRRVPAAACFVVPRISSWSEFRRVRDTSILDWTTLVTREKVAIFIPDNVAPQEMRDCLHEEVAQALGPLNDLYRLPDSVFNDDNFNTVLSGFDMLMLRVTYDPALSSGQTPDAVAARLPEIFARLNPAGDVPAAPIIRRTPRAWVDAIEEALGPGTPRNMRVQAADRAVTLARQANLYDARLAFSYFALGRLSLSRSVEDAVNAFLAASNIYDQIAPGGIQAAHVDMQLAAYALSSGRPDEALTLTTRAMPAATAAQNAALLATLMMLRAEALEALGRLSEARSVRLDSIAWGRYGFGDERVLGARLSEVAALAP